MTSVRCPSCDAALPAGASWCSLCFARFGAGEAPAATAAVPTPVPSVDPWVAAAIAETPVAPPAPVAPAPVAAPMAPVAPAISVAPPAPVASAPVAAAGAVATVDALTWPCTACGARVEFSESTCPSCHTPFMGGATPDISLKVPGVGDLVHMSSGMKFGVMAGGAAALATLLVLLFLILGHIF